MADAVQQPVVNAPIPPPPDFPVRWGDPADERLFWTLDLIHKPEPLPALSFVRMRDITLAGMNAAGRELDYPTYRVGCQINTYFYGADVPIAGTPEEVAEVERRSDEKVRAAVARFGATWVREWLPEVQQHLAAWAAFPLAEATAPQLLAHFDETVARARRIAVIHFSVNGALYSALSLFEELHGELFGDEDGFARYRLLQGFPNKTVEVGEVLWRLSRAALATPAVRAILAECPADGALAALAGEPAAADFLAALQRFLAEYGERGDKFDFSTPSWIEDPAPVFKSLQGYLSQPARDLAAERAALAVEREACLAATRQRLRGYPAPVRAEFEALLTAAQEATVISEDHNFWIDYRSSHQERLVVLECGRRLARAGVLARADDAFCLTYDELRDAIAALADPNTDARPVADPWRQRVAAQREAIAHFAAITPPRALGTRPSGPTAGGVRERGRLKMVGGPPPSSDDPGVLRGHAGSPGRARGPARVILSIADADRLRPGDILVTQATAPPWTPLFGTAAAVVTDAGGVLSHCAVVAREYGLPAVVGTGAATRLIRDGQLVEVDGDAGLVRLLDADV